LPRETTWITAFSPIVEQLSQLFRLAGVEGGRVNARNYMR